MDAPHPNVSVLEVILCALSRHLAWIWFAFPQEFYGTCVYFLSFVVNGRYKTLTISEVLIFVCFTNGT